MRILFIGNVLSSFILFQILLKHKANLVGAITTKKSKFNSDFKDISRLCKKNKIQLHYTKKINSKKTIHWIKDKKPDYIFCFGWSQILNKNIISIPKKYIVGFHPSKLPSFKGRHPIIWSIILGAKTTASTFFKINKDVDDGPIIDQKIVKILKNDNSFKLYKRIMNKAKLQLIEILKKIKKNNITFIIKNKQKSSSLRKRYFKDGEIDWRMNGQNISRLVRALDYPYPGAHLQYKNKIYKIWKIKIIKNKQMFEPGKVLSNHNQKPIIKCADSAIQIIKSDPKISLKGVDYL